MMTLTSPILSSDIPLASMEGASTVMANPPFASCLELVVVVLQVFGLGMLGLSRFSATTRWSDRGKLGVVLALFGLGVSGALCGQYGSNFAQFAGFTMTALLMGLTLGGHPRGMGRALEPNLPARSTWSH